MLSVEIRHYLLMKLTFTSLGLLFALHAAALADSPMVGLVKDYEFRNPRTWQVGGHNVVFEYGNKTATSIRDGDSIIATLRYPQVITGIIASDNGKTLLVLVNTERQFGGLDYDRLMTIREDGSDHQLTIHEWLSSGQPYMKLRWVVELGAISEDGQRVLVKMAEQDKGRPPYVVGWVWETWDLKAEKMLGTGLKLCD